MRKRTPETPETVETPERAGGFPPSHVGEEVIKRESTAAETASAPAQEDAKETPNES